ncbi:MAG: ATP-binding protein [Kiritimatiellae bacterium]|nr:ATP-binding protein [Kiritimatiellia bacterium]
MIKREMAAKARELWGKYPVLTLTGPRQSGKTTLARSVFPEAEYVNLEDPEVHALALSDMREFLRRHPAPAVFDEVQYVPELLRYVQAAVDEKRSPSQYVLKGSHQPALRAAIGESLAGRTGLLELLPLTLGELAAAGVEKFRDEWIFDGFMPRLYDSTLGSTEFYRDYFRTYVERDVRQLANLHRLSAFETFVRLLAGRVGQVLNVNALSDDAGISVPTVKAWLSVMEASYVIYVMRPYYRNFGKRFIKSPKVYFTETGLVSYLLGIRSSEQVASHPLMGNLFENMAVMEILKRRLNRGEEPDMYFLRTSSGLEADIVVENGGRLDLYEVKASSTFRADMMANLRRLAGFIPETGRLAVVYAGRAAGTHDGVEVVNFADMEV